MTLKRENLQEVVLNLWFTELDVIWLINKLQLGSLLAIFGSVGVVG